VERNPHRLIYASSPERGLEQLLVFFGRAREVVPDLELHCFYGWGPEGRQNIPYRRHIERLMRQDGVTWRGRVGQEELWTAYLESGIWCYPTMFQETFCVCACEAQALGAVPIYNPVYALRDTVFTGLALHGDCRTDRLLQMRYAYEIAHLALSPEVQERIRKTMMPEARARFDLERVVDRFEELACEDGQSHATRRADRWFHAGSASPASAIGFRTEETVATAPTGALSETGAPGKL